MNETLIVETTPAGGDDLWIECRTCGRCSYLSKGPIGHKRGCSTSAQYSATETVAVPITTTTDSELRAFARNVRTYGQAKGRDSDVLAAVRAGYLSESDAMNTDD